MFLQKIILSFQDSYITFLSLRKLPCQNEEVSLIEMNSVWAGENRSQLKCHNNNIDFINIIRIFHGCEVRIEKSIRGSMFDITRLCRVMPNSDPEGWIFLSAPNNYDRFFFLHISWSQAFDFNVGVAINEWRSYTLTPAILKVDGRVWRRNDVNSQRLNDRVTWPPIQPMNWQHVLLFDFYLSHGSDKGM